MTVAPLCLSAAFVSYFPRRAAHCFKIMLIFNGPINRGLPKTRKRVSITQKPHLMGDLISFLKELIDWLSSSLWFDQRAGCTTYYPKSGSNSAAFSIKKRYAGRGKNQLRNLPVTLAAGIIKMHSCKGFSLKKYPEKIIRFSFISEYFFYLRFTNKQGIAENPKQSRYHY